jgi:hypothetical protein
MDITIKHRDLLFVCRSCPLDDSTLHVVVWYQDEQIHERLISVIGWVRKAAKQYGKIDG